MNCLFIIQIALTLMMLSPAQCFVTLSNKRKRLAFSTNKRLQISSLEGDLCGKVLAKRFIYRLAPTKSTVSAPYAIEERQYFSIGTDNNLKPLGDKCFFIRADVKSESQSSPKSMKENAPNRSYMHIGSSLYQFKNAVKEKDSEDLDSCFVMALYCMANPNLTVGNVLEVGSGVGIGGILSCIGAGVASATSEASENSSAGEGGYHQSIEDIATESIDDEVDASSPSKLNAPISPRLTRLSLTDSSAQLLEKCDENVRKSSFPASKVDIYELDLKARAPGKLMAKFDCILGCDCAYYFPLVTPLARIVANSLRPSPYDRVDNTQKVIGQFIHISPEHEESIKHLLTKLSEGYKMNTKTENWSDLILFLLFWTLLNKKRNNCKKKWMERVILMWHTIRRQVTDMFL